MVKKYYLLMVAMLLGTASLWARPGYTKPLDVPQPDGTTVTLLMHGDEFLSFMTTIDGYTVIKGEDGYYRYADKQDGQLTATSVVAKNPSERQAADRAFLAARKKMLQPEMTESQRRFKESASQLYLDYNKVMAGDRRAVTIWDRINYNNFKGLVVLVEFNDRKFTMDDPQAFYQKLTSEKNYSDDSKTHYPVSVTGSARDYFHDNSMGIFDPTFDVIGPVTINYSCTYPSPKKNGQDDPYFMENRMIPMIRAVMNQVNASLDLTQYDLDNNNYIDMVYFIFAGYGSYVQGNNEKYIWPHANDMSSYSTYYGMKYDGKYFGRYACSVEIQDQEVYADYPGHPWLDGIGTICHEFSHVLGLADHYDADYEGSGGQSKDPGLWDVMAGGADWNYGLTPVGYNAFERSMLGFAEPQLLDVAGNYQLEAFNTSNQSYYVKTAKANEEFYLENRQKQGWDTYLPGHGLLIWRADTSEPNVWRQNTVNNNPSNMYFELLNRAAFTDRDLTADTNDSWGSKGAAIDLFDITENDGVVTFEAGKDVYPIVVEDFEATPLTSENATGVAGKFCTWDLENATIENTQTGIGSGEHLAVLKRSGTLTSSVLEKGLRTLKFKVVAGGYQIRFLLKVSADNGQTWTNLSSSTTINKNKEKEFSFYDIPAGSRLQFQTLATSTSAVSYLDDIEVTFPKDGDGIDDITANNRPSSATYNMAGQRVGNGFKGLVIKNGKKRVNK